MIICGIDEAGRGPIAGDLVVAGCVLLKDIDGINDSKKLTPKKRELLFAKIIKNSIYHIVKISPSTIDKKGLSWSLKYALEEIIDTINAEKYIFDGNSNFGVSGIDTLVKADAKITQVGAASIIAKVTHDRDILELSKLYPLYELHKHKGYATPLHIELIKKYGYSQCHRKSYKIKSLVPTLDL